MDPLDLYNFDSACPEVWPYFIRFPPCMAPKGPSPLICTSLEALVLRVMHTKFGQDWVRTFRVEVENINFPYITLYMTVNFDPKTRNLFFNGSFRFVQL